jgi:hypothetical protein
MPNTMAQWLPIVVLIPALAFWAYSLVDFSRTPDIGIRTFARDTWLVILTFGSVVGCAAWWLNGRPQHPQRP